MDGATQDRWRRGAAVAAVLGRVVGHRGPGSEAPVSSSGSGSSSSRSRSDRRGHEEGEVDDDDLLVGDLEGPGPVVTDDQQRFEGQLDALLSATAPAQPIGPGGVPWAPPADLPVSIDGEPLGDENNRISEDAAAESSEEATLVDSAATSVVGEGEATPATELWPPGAEDAPLEHREHQGPERDDVVAGAAAASPVAAATDASAAAGMLGDLEKKLDARIGEVKLRLTSASSGALSDISASQRAMIDQMTCMNDRKHSEAALQRDAHRSLAAS